jgi:nicotinamide mononucleotide adenylyltransferase
MSYLGVGGSDLPLRICIGSSQAEQSLENPWNAEEREKMIRLWLDGRDAEIVHIPDLGDPPNYVRHAEKFHGPPGILFTTDEATSSLYRDADWFVVEGGLEQREDWQGWRIRSTLKMLSTVSEREAALLVMQENVPRSVSELLFDNGWLHRLAFLGRDFEVVG